MNILKDSYKIIFYLVCFSKFECVYLVSNNTVVIINVSSNIHGKYRFTVFQNVKEARHTFPLMSDYKTGQHCELNVTL